MKRKHFVETRGFWIWVNASLLATTLNEGLKAFEAHNLPVLTFCAFVSALNGACIYWTYNKGRKAKPNAQ